MNLEIYSKSIQSLIKSIHNCGHLIGLHPSYECYNSYQLLNNELNTLKKVLFLLKINSNVIYSRMHFLRWSTPITLNILDSAGITYDNSLTYADHSGFRCGTCFEYQAFDINNDKVLKIRIKPLIVMECTVISEKYLGLGASNEALDKILKLKNECKVVNGTFTMLWHNTELSDNSMKNLYQSIL